MEKKKGLLAMLSSLAETKVKRDANEELVKVESKLEKTNQLLAANLRTQSLWRSFFNGLITALGGTVGLAIVLYVVVLILRRLQYVPGIGQDFKLIIDLLKQVKPPGAAS